MKTIRSIFLLPLLAAPFTVLAVEPIQLTPQKMKLPPIEKKANLVVHVLGWDGEFCGVECPQVKNDLKIGKATCRVRVRIANEGNAAAGAFAVQLRYTHWNGTSVLQKTQSVGAGLPAKNQGTSWIKDIYFDNLGYYKTDKPFIAKVDYQNQVQESNEADNEKSVVLN